MIHGWTRFRVGSSLKVIFSSLNMLPNGMDTDALRREVDSNYDFFQRSLALLMPDHRDAYALLRHCKIEGFFDRPGDAYRAGKERFSDEIFSIQQVTDKVEDLGFFSRAGV